MTGGTGNKLKPLTYSVSKQLMPIYDKTMLYYPLTTLMLGGIQEFLIITTEEHFNSFKKLIKNGSQQGISISNAIQSKPKGIAEAFIIGENFLNNLPSALILGDNLFHIRDIVSLLKKANEQKRGATIFTQGVRDPHNYGVDKSDDSGNPISITEKPKKFISCNAVTGLYFLLS